MKYIILCGSNHNAINGIPRQLVGINGERVLDRTIRLLRENGVDDIAITATDSAFNSVCAERIEYKQENPKIWINCFYPMDDPVCYIFGDVYFSEQAIETIVKTETNDIEFFASAPPFSEFYRKPWAEPFAFKVQNTAHFKECVGIVKQYIKDGRWRRDPIAWEFWQVVKGTQINRIVYNNYTAINDYTCDIDCEADIEKIEMMVKRAQSQ